MRSAIAAAATIAASLLLQGCEELPEVVSTTTKTTTTTTTRTTTSTTTTITDPNATTTMTTTTETMTSTTQRCSEEREDCRSTLCCKNSTHQKCYKKNQAYFACKEECDPRKADPLDVEWEQFPWSCEVAEKMSEDWVNGTYTTGYWDCCRPSCAWPGKGSVDNPVRTCQAVSGQTLVGQNEWALNVCFDEGQAAACTDQQPFVVDGYPRLSMGFAAAAVAGLHGLTGDANCGQCFLLRFTDEQHAWGKGAHPDLVGKAMIVQVTNIGYDVTGDHSFDIQIPGAGQGIFTEGCATQFPGDDTLDFDCSNDYGGCGTIEGCALLPESLRPGCEWRYNWYRWNVSAAGTDNPFVQFKRVRCPDELLALSLSQPLDDMLFEPVDFTEYA